MGWYAGERNGVPMVEHAGDGANFHANVVLVPDRGLGIVLLENEQNGLKPEPMSGIARGVTSLLLGAHVSPFLRTVVPQVTHQRGGSSSPSSRITRHGLPARFISTCVRCED